MIGEAKSEMDKLEEYLIENGIHYMRDMIREAVFKAYDDAIRERMQMSEEEAEKVAARFF